MRRNIVRRFALFGRKFYELDCGHSIAETRLKVPSGTTMWCDFCSEHHAKPTPCSTRWNGKEG